MFRTTTIFLIATIVMMQPARADELRVGVLLPLSGPFADIGAAIRTGLENGVAHSGKAVRLIIEDDQSFNRVAVVAAYRRLTEIERVDVVAVTVLPVLKLIQPLRIGSVAPPLVVIWDHHEKFHDPANCIFTIGFSNSQAGKEMAVHAGKRLGLWRIALVSAADEWSEKVSEAFVERFTADGGIIVQRVVVELTETDFRTVIGRFKRDKVDGIFFPLYFESLTALVRQARELRYAGQLLTGEGLLPNELRVLGDASKGVWFQRIGATNDVTPHSPYRGFVALGQDGGAVISAARRAVDLTYCEAFRRTTVEGVLGELNPGESLPRKRGLVLEQAGHP